MNIKEIMQRAKFDHHITYNVFNDIDAKTADGIWKEIQAVNAGEKLFSDLLPDGVTTIGEMIEDLQLDCFILENAIF